MRWLETVRTEGLKHDATNAFQLLASRRRILQGGNSDMGDDGRQEVVAKAICHTIWLTKLIVVSLINCWKIMFRICFTDYLSLHDLFKPHWLGTWKLCFQHVCYLQVLQENHGEYLAGDLALPHSWVQSRMRCWSLGWLEKAFSEASPQNAWCSDLPPTH